jgi:biotin carboxyl carrier protein
MASKLTLRVNERTAEVEVESLNGTVRVRLGDRWYTAELLRTNQYGLYSLLLGGRSYEIFARERPGGLEVLVGNQVYSVDTDQKHARGAVPEQTGAWTLHSPMSGQVVEVRVAVGDAVQSGQPLVVIESMKMNNELTSTRSGTVETIHVAIGDRVEKGRPLVSLG